MPCSWLSGAVAERARDAVSVAYVLQDLLTRTDVRTRMAQLGSPESPGMTSFPRSLASRASCGWFLPTESLAYPLNYQARCSALPGLVLLALVLRLSGLPLSFVLCIAVAL